MTIISIRSFLSIQCRSIDFLLRVFLNVDIWLNVCVATERASTGIKSIYFNKKITKQAAEIVIVILLIVVIDTTIHDPIYRRLVHKVNDANEKRIWYVFNYLANLKVYNYIMNILHFFCPFVINLLLATSLIVKKSCQKGTVHPQRPYNELSREQIEQYKCLLTALVVLSILVLPRLIITFVSACMKSTDDSWLFLIRYFVSFIPSLLTFVIFILPSEFYKNKLRKSIQRYRINMRRRLHLL